jgi:hypothetical protein
MKINGDLNEMNLRTSSYRGKESYDRFLSTCNISSLQALSHKYENELNTYKKNHDMNDADNWRRYNDKQQIKKMINEELFVRIMNKYASSKYLEAYYDSLTGCIIDDKQGAIGFADYSEDESSIIVRDIEGSVEYEYDGSDYVDESPRKKRKHIYESWYY